MTDTLLPVDRWVEVCDLEDLDLDRGAAVLLGGRQIALFRLSPDDRLFAVSNYDPCSGAYVISRGIVGSRGDAPKVASPMYKQSFDLRTGVCLDQPGIALETFDVARRGSRVVVRLPSC